MTKKLLVMHFAKFLREHGTSAKEYEHEYLLYAQRYRERIHTIQDRMCRSIIDSDLHWSATERGHAFWHDLQTKWRYEYARLNSTEVEL